MIYRKLTCYHVFFYANSEYLSYIPIEYWVRKKAPKSLLKEI